MKQLFSLLTVGLLPLCVYAQKPPPGPPIDETSDCYLYGVDYSAIICRYDANGGRIFRGFDCRTSLDEHKNQARTANAPPNADSKNSAAQAAVALVGNVTVSPNPTEGLVNIVFENLPPNGAVLYLTDTKAMLVHEIAVVDTNTTLSLSSLPSGVYTFVVVCKGKVLWQTKVVKI